MVPNLKTFKLPICDSVFLYCSLLLFVIEIIVAVFTICKVWFSSSEVSAAVLLCNFIAISLASNLLSLYLCLTDMNGAYRSRLISMEAIIFHLCQLGIIWRLVNLVRRKTTDANRARVLICRFLVLQSAYGLFLGIFQAVILSYEIMSKHVFQQPHMLVVLLMCNLTYACWTFAGFHRNLLRAASLSERHFISWPGVLSQWLWRLGTVASRIVALAAYASMYRWYALLFAVLHAVTMFTFLLVLRLLDGRKPLKKNAIGIYTLLGVSVISVVDFVNHSSKAFRLRISVHYVIVIAENSLLFGIWYKDLKDRYAIESLWIRNFTIAFVFVGFLFGLVNLILYYSCFHIRILARNLPNVGNSNNRSANGIERVGIVRCNLPLPLQPRPTVPVRKKKLPSQADPALLQSVSSTNEMSTVSTSIVDGSTVADTTPKKSTCSLQRTLSAPMDQKWGSSHPSNNPYASETALVLDAPKFKANGSEILDQQHGAHSLPRKHRKLRPTLSSSYVNNMFQQNESSGDSSSDIDLEIRRSNRPPRRRKALSGTASQRKPESHQRSPHHSNEAVIETVF